MGACVVVSRIRIRCSLSQVRWFLFQWLACTKYIRLFQMDLRFIWAHRVIKNHWFASVIHEHHWLRSIIFRGRREVKVLVKIFRNNIVGEYLSRRFGVILVDRIIGLFYNRSSGLRRLFLLLFILFILVFIFLLFLFLFALIGRPRLLSLALQVVFLPFSLQFGYFGLDFV